MSQQDVLELAEHGPPVNHRQGRDEKWGAKLNEKEQFSIKPGVFCIDTLSRTSAHAQFSTLPILTVGVKTNHQITLRYPVSCDDVALTRACLRLLFLPLRFLHESNTTPALIAGSQGSSLSVLVSISVAFSVLPHVSLPPTLTPHPLSPTRTEHLHQMRWTIG